MIKYLGSKRRLIPHIVAAIDSIAGAAVVVDAFSGTSRVGQALKARGYGVVANDHNAYAHTLARCYIEADRGALLKDATRLVRELNAVPGRDGWFTETYCRRARFFQERNGARIEAVRDAIAQKSLPPLLESIALTSLLEAADRVDSTVGVHMAYLKSWSARSHNALQLRVPELIDAPAGRRCAAVLGDAIDVVADVAADVVYLDPPYNHHSYLSNYHIWETLVRWDAPEVYGKAQKRVECQEKHSAFNRKGEFVDAFTALVTRARARALVVSFNDEGYLSRDELVSILAARGPVRVVAIDDHPRYVGARIGIFSPQGEKVGAVSHTKNTEFLFIVDGAASTKNASTKKASKKKASTKKASKKKASTKKASTKKAKKKASTKKAKKKRAR